MAKIHTPSSTKEVPLATVKSMISLSTHGFGLVVALAWNELIQKIISDYIEPYLGQGTGVASLLLYAMIITFLAVMVTMQLTNLQQRLEKSEK